MYLLCFLQYHLHNMSCRPQEDIRHQASLSCYDHQEPQEVFYLWSPGRKGIPTDTDSSCGIDHLKYSHNVCLYSWYSSELSRASREPNVVMTTVRMTTSLMCSQYFTAVQRGRKAKFVHNQSYKSNEILNHPFCSRGLRQSLSNPQLCRNYRLSTF